VVRGQIDTMQSRSGPAGRLALAIVLVYLLIVVNFQSWLDPFIIITALPAALAGIVCSCSHAHDAQRAGADGRHHVRGRGHRQQHSGGQLRQGAAGRRKAIRERPRSKPASRVFVRC
jgi:hypothetical protein